MIIEFAPLFFGTAALLAIFLFFSVAEHRAFPVEVESGDSQRSVDERVWRP